MTARLPIPGSDDGDWGDILNNFLEVSLSSTGTLNSGIVADSQVVVGAAINPNKIAGTAEIQSNKNQPSGYAGLNASTQLPLALLPANIPISNLSVTGTPSNTTYLRGDGSWTAAPVTSVEGMTGVVTGLLQSSNNLSDVVDSGSSRANLHVPTLTPAAAVATSNISSLTTTTSTIDGYSLVSGDLVLLTAQSTSSQNGLWSVPSSGSWTRPTEFASGVNIKGRSILVMKGTIYSNTEWGLDTPTAGITIDTSSQTWSLLSTLSNSYVANTATATGQAPISTGVDTYAWTTTGTIDQTDTPQAPTSNPTPGGTGLASDAGHAHILPTATQIETVLSAAGISIVAPLWQGITSGNITIPRGHQDDSSSYGSTPASGTVHYTYFIAQYSGSCGHIRLQTGSGATSGATYANVALYTVNSSTGALTQVAVGTSKSSLSGTYAGQTFTLTASYSIVAGTLYAVGLLQVASTAASLLGAWFNGAYLGGSQGLAFTGATGQSTIPASASQPTNASNFPIYYELYT